MAVYSMTGFGAARSAPPAEAGEPGAAASASPIEVDLRSVNGRFLDLTLKLPDEARMLETALREAVGAALKRGKVELRLNLGRPAQDRQHDPSPEALMRAARLQSMVRGWLPEARALSVAEALAMAREGAPRAVDEARVLAIAQEAIERLREARAREGARLVQVLRARIATLRDLAAQAEPLLPAAIARQRERFLQRFADAIAAAGGGESVSPQAAQERALAEAAAHALRIDVDEELQRLRTHLDEIERLLKKGGELGKRLDFLIQELHREANTFGSKSPVVELTNLSVEMKVAIEQMREQVQNIE